MTIERGYTGNAGRAGRAGRGFSLTELMIVVSIMGLLLAVSAPAMGRYLQTWRLNGEANEMATVLRLARTAAVTKNTNVVFVFDATDGEYYYIEDADGNGVHNGGEYQSALQEFPAGIQFESYTVPQQWITFGPKGNTVDGGSLVLRNSRDSTRRIRVFSGTGNITID
jgi:prepilin-type N-terminal cleavage/methylation domain-containing protein